jgi:hypothetical protein
LSLAKSAGRWLGDLVHNSADAEERQMTAVGLKQYEVTLEKLRWHCEPEASAS